MRKILLSIILALCTVIAYSFENKEDAINFVWEYAADNSTEYGGIEQCRVGILESETDTLINRVTMLDSYGNHSTTYDTISVPDNHFVFFIASRDFWVGGGCQPVKYLFVSKKDSTFEAIETCGNFDEDYEWEMPYISMLTRNAVIDTLKAKIDYITGGKDCRAYFIEDYEICDQTLVSEASANSETSWQFVLEIQDSLFFLIEMHKEMGINRVASYSAKKLNLNCLNTDGLKLAYSNVDNGLYDSVADEEIIVYPNPASEFISVDLDDCVLNLYSSTGVLVKKTIGNRMYVSDISSGLYLLEICRDNFKTYRRVMVK